MNDTLPQTFNPACDIPDTIPPRPTWLKRKPTRTTDAAARAARKYNVNPGDVLALMPEALALIRRDAETIELARQRGRQLTGLDARIIASRENKYLDHSTAVRFDETSRELAAEFPELGFDPDAHDTPARVWAFIAEGRQPIPCRHSDCVAEQAAQWCEQLETEDFPDDADGFDPPSWEETATPSEISDRNPASYIQGTPCLPSQHPSVVQLSSQSLVKSSSPRNCDREFTSSVCHDRTIGHVSELLTKSAKTSPTPPSTASCHKPEAERGDDPAYVASELLTQASPYCEYGEGYSRNIAASANRLRDIIDRGHSASMIAMGCDELRIRLQVHGTTIHPVCDVQPEGNQHADENPSRHVPLPTSRDRPPRRDGIRRETPRPLAGGRTLPEVRSERLASHLVRQDCDGCGVQPRSVRRTASEGAIISGRMVRDVQWLMRRRCDTAGRTPRLGRVAEYNPAYVAGNGLPASIRARDGPRLIRYAASVA